MVEELGVNAVGLSGKDGGLLKVEKRYSEGQDIGFVGNITEVNPKILFDMLEKDFLPIVAPIGYDENFDTYNTKSVHELCFLADFAYPTADFLSTAVHNDRLEANQL